MQIVVTTSFLRACQTAPPQTARLYLPGASRSDPDTEGTRRQESHPLAREGSGDCRPRRQDAETDPYLPADLGVYTRHGARTHNMRLKVTSSPGQASHVLPSPCQGSCKHRISELEGSIWSEFPGASRRLGRQQEREPRGWGGVSLSRAAARPRSGLRRALAGPAAVTGPRGDPPPPSSAGGPGPGAPRARPPLPPRRQAHSDRQAPPRGACGRQADRRGRGSGEEWGAVSTGGPRVAQRSPGPHPASHGRARIGSCPGRGSLHLCGAEAGGAQQPHTIGLFS